MWIMLNDAFFSFVKKDCSPDQLLVRARREGDIEKVFGRLHKVERDETADYLYRARIPRKDVEAAISGELRRIEYGNFKDSVDDRELHNAYIGVWHAMAKVQNPRPYSKARDGLIGTISAGRVLLAQPSTKKPPKNSENWWPQEIPPKPKQKGKRK